MNVESQLSLAVLEEFHSVHNDTQLLPYRAVDLESSSHLLTSYTRPSRVSHTYRSKFTALW